MTSVAEPAAQNLDAPSLPTRVPRIRSASLAACACLLLCAPGTSSAQEAGPVSPLLSALQEDLATDAPGAVPDFWRAVGERGTPLVEEAGPGRSLVTFVFRGDDNVEAVKVESGLIALEIDGVEEDLGALGRMTRLDSTDVWYRSYTVPNDLRAPYVFQVTEEGDADPQRVLDPLNPVRYEPHERFPPESVVELAGAPPQPWRKHEGEGPGRWRVVQVPVGADTTQVYVYAPTAYDPSRADPYPIFLGLSSYTFGIAMSGDWILEELIGRGQMEPAVMVLVGVSGDMEADAYRPAADYLADDVLPRIREILHVTDDPREIVIGGTSRRGLISGIVAFHRPDVVANVLSLSGSFYWKPEAAAEYEWLAGRIAASPRRDVRWLLRAGNLETVVTRTNRGHYMVATNRHLRDVLLARGYDVDYGEFTGVHSDLNWQSGLAEGLRHYFGR